MADSPTTPGDPESRALLQAIGMTHRDAAIGIGDREWVVYMLGPWKFPSLQTWEGWPVRYERMGPVMAINNG